MKGITYDLKSQNTTSKEFYKDLENFTDKILLEVYPLLQPNFVSFNNYLKDQGCREVKFQEVALEFITLGTLWRIYSRFALKLQSTKSNVMRVLSNHKFSSIISKKKRKKLKGLLTGALMWSSFDSRPMVAEQTLGNMEKLISWLQASGEFTQEVRKIEIWLSYLKTITDDEAHDILRTATSVALWFEEQSLNSLGKYTLNVQEFLNSLDEKERWREDSIFRMRRRVEYHLNMFGSEVLNRSYKKEFLNTKHKILLLPACMCSSIQCRKQQSKDAYICAMCTEKCKVNNLNDLGNTLGFDTLIIPHESSVATMSKDQSIFHKETGIIGVACVLNLLSGGWMLEEQGIPAQCVLLDYCGCKSHWHEEGIPTGINFSELQKIVQGS